MYLWLRLLISAFIQSLVQAAYHSATVVKLRNGGAKDPAEKDRNYWERWRKGTYSPLLNNTIQLGVWSELIIIYSQDTFEDAPEITPKARAKSPQSTRSLTERRPSSASATTKDPKKNDTAHITDSTTNNSMKHDEVKDNHTSVGDRKNSTQKIGHVVGLDDVSLGDG